MPISVAFRADASLDIGAGHVMRCLALAEALSAAGIVSRFICRGLPGHLAERISASGFRVDLLSSSGRKPAAGPDSPRHAHWLPVTQQEDARQTRALLADERPDWVVVDHYALDIRWQREIRQSVSRVMTIDDLADRIHDADLLLDQTLGREDRDYEGLVPDECRRLLGPRYALLRPEFAATRARSLTRRRDGHLRHILVGMGGIDRSNVTGAVLEALDDLGGDLRITAALGRNSPSREAVLAQAEAMRSPVRVSVDNTEMAHLMAEADLAVGAGGTMSWERCCLGLPTLLLVLAENQMGSARALVKAGACIYLGQWGDVGWRQALVSAVWRLGEAEALQALSDAAARICDGEGAGRVTGVLLAMTPVLRQAGSDDTARVWTWRHADGASRFYRSGRDTSYDTHARWFGQALSDPNRILLIAEHRGEPIAHLRFDRQPGADRSATVSICLAPAARGQGLARACLQAGMMHARSRGVMRIIAEVHAGNAASIRLFEGADFHFRERDKDFITYQHTETTPKHDLRDIEQ